MLLGFKGCPFAIGVPDVIEKARCTAKPANGDKEGEREEIL